MLLVGEEISEGAIKFDGWVLSVDLGAAKPRKMNDGKSVRLRAMAEKHVVGGSLAPCKHVHRNAIEKVPGWKLALELVEKHLRVLRVWVIPPVRQSRSR